ncbi:DUF2306 domain-containing protein [Bradyrhizobium sp.]|uniref:DUF2306 domain-containing protein n=1 Tax=Bradyrhizobium sp. TaxID=376 RepID=UPI003C697C2A
MRTLLVWVSCAVLAALIVRFYGRAVMRYTHFDAPHYRSFWPAKWWLVAHLGGGSLALLLGPFQFVGWIRRNYVKAHRWMGRLYLSGVLVGSIAAVYMGLRVSRDKAFGVALLYLALAWVVTSGMAYLSVMRRQFAAHREWMIRSYVVTFAFVLFRLGEDLNLYGGLGPSAQAVMVAWMAWAVPLLFTEVALQWRRSMGVKARG